MGAFFLFRNCQPAAVRIFLYCLLIIGLLIFVQGFLWHVLAFLPNNPKKVDCIVVFHGSIDRVATGIELANQSVGKNIIISPAGSTALTSLRKKFDLNPRVNVHQESFVRSTFENALFSGDLIRQNGWESVMLVTHDYHMPRSFFLLKAMLFGTDVDVKCYRVPYATGVNRFHRFINKERHLINEMLRSWGSLYESAFCTVSKGTPQQSHKEQGWIIWLKKTLLF